MSPHAPPNSTQPATSEPLLTHPDSSGIVAAVSIPAIAWFFMGRSPATADKGAEMKDPRREERKGGTDSGNEEPSRSVPEGKPESKETKPANPKAVAGDAQRLGTEVRVL